MVWEMFHVLLNPSEILNSAFSVVILIPRQMENPQGNNQANNTDEYLLSTSSQGFIFKNSIFPDQLAWRLSQSRLEDRDRHGAHLRVEKQRSLELRKGQDLP